MIASAAPGLLVFLRPGMDGMLHVCAVGESGRMANGCHFRLREERGRKTLPAQSDDIERRRCGREDRARR